MLENAWLIFDMHNLAWRAFHSKKDLSYKGKYTGVLYGIFTDIVLLQKRFHTHNIAFAFDSAESFRLNVFRDYKISRKKKFESLNEEEREKVKGFKQQVRLLRTDYLPSLGFQNVFYSEGYEADDIIASIVKEDNDREFIIVSSDEDLYQLLKGNVRIYQPQQDKVVNLQLFFKRFGIKPKKWPKVKALMGDGTDDIPGIKGVGVVKAIQYLNPETAPKKTPTQYRLYEAVRVFRETGEFQRNLDLVTLPYLGCPKFELRSDNVTKMDWKETMVSLGMKSLRKAYPLSALQRNRNERED